MELVCHTLKGSVIYFYTADNINICHNIFYFLQIWYFYIYYHDKVLGNSLSFFVFLLSKYSTCKMFLVIPGQTLTSVSWFHHHWHIHSYTPEQLQEHLLSLWSSVIFLIYANFLVMLSGGLSETWHQCWDWLLSGGLTETWHQSWDWLLSGGLRIAQPLECDVYNRHLQVSDIVVCQPLAMDVLTWLWSLLPPSLPVPLASLLVISHPSSPR